jgi:hypothetical protein
MIYMLEFLGLTMVALSLAASPVLVNILDRFFPRLDEEGRTAEGYGLSKAMASERAEMRDEIRRVTNILEAHSLDIRQSSNAAGHTFR